MLYEDVDFKTLSDRYTNKSHSTVPHTYRWSQSKFIFNKSSAKNYPHYGKSTVVAIFTVKLDATNSFPSNTAEVRHIYLKVGHIMRNPVFVICE